MLWHFGLDSVQTSFSADLCIHSKEGCLRFLDFFCSDSTALSAAVLPWDPRSLLKFHPYGQTLCSMSLYNSFIFGIANSTPGYANLESAAFLCARRFACPSTLKPQHAPYLDVRLVRRQSMLARDSAVSAAPRCVEPRIRPSLPAATLQEAGKHRCSHDQEHATPWTRRFQKS